MNEIKTILINYSIVSLFCSVFEYLTPQKSKGTMKIISSVILISLIVIPIVKTDFETVFENVQIESEQIEKESNNITLLQNLMEKEIYKITENIIINNGVNEYEINIKTFTKNETNEIVLEEVNVKISETYKENLTTLTEELKKEYGETVKIEVNKND